MYIAIIGDMKNSKEIINRGDVQKKLAKVLTAINKQYTKDIYSKFIITLGDEFQGLLSRGCNTMNIICEIQRYMHPIDIRFGIGIGPLATEVIREMSIGADGPAYYNAREAVNRIKEDEKRNQTNPADIRIELEGEANQSLEELINTTLSLMTGIKEFWSDRQREIIGDMLEHQDNQTDVAKRLGIKQPTVQKSLSKAKYYTYKNAKDTINKALDSFLKQ